MKAPGPSPIEFSQGIGTETAIFFDQLRNKYGDVIRFKVPFARPMYLLSHPDYAKYVLSHNATNFVRQDFVSRRFRSLMGNGSVIAEGDLWARQRKIISPVFQRVFLKNVFQNIENQTTKLIERWKKKAEKGEAIELVSEMRSLTLDILWRVLFHQPTNEMEEVIYQPVELGLDYLGAPVPFFLSKWLPTFKNWKFFFALKKLEDVIQNMINERRKNIGQVDDMLDFLLRYKNPETSEGLSDKLIIEEIKTMTPAGFLTTTAAISWLFYELGKNPQYIAPLNEECRTILQNGHFDFKKIELAHGGKPLLLKNPPNTGRVNALLELFPNAKFVFLFRNPYQVFFSTRALWHRTLTKHYTLQSLYDEEIDDLIFQYYRTITDAYLEQRGNIPENNLIEVRYEELEKNPFETVKSVYTWLDLPNWKRAKTHILDKIYEERHYKKYSYSYPQNVQDRIYQEWKRYIELWEYERL